MVVLHGHCDDIEGDDNSNEEVQILAGAHLVDEQTRGGVVRVVWLALSFYGGREWVALGDSMRWQYTKGLFLG